MGLTKEEQNEEILDNLIKELEFVKGRYSKISSFIIKCNYKLSYLLEGLKNLGFEIISTDNTELYNAKRESLQLIILRHNHLIFISIKEEKGRK